jgi:hypothetical protein
MNLVNNRNWRDWDIEPSRQLILKTGNYNVCGLLLASVKSTVHIPLQVCISDNCHSAILHLIV